METGETTQDVKFPLQTVRVGAGWILYKNTIYYGSTACSSTFCDYSVLISSSNYYSSDSPYVQSFTAQEVAFMNFTVGDYTWEANAAYNGLQLFASALAFTSFSLLH
jgi:hypothetical protein